MGCLLGIHSLLLNLPCRAHTAYGTDQQHLETARLALRGQAVGDIRRAPVARTLHSFFFCLTAGLYSIPATCYYSHWLQSIVVHATTVQ